MHMSANTSAASGFQLSNVAHTPPWSPLQKGTTMQACKQYMHTHAGEIIIKTNHKPQCKLKSLAQASEQYMHMQGK